MLQTGVGRPADALPDGPALRDTIDAVFRLPAFTRPLRETFWGWVGAAFDRLWRAFWQVVPGATRPVMFWVVAAVAALLVVYAVSRAVARREGRAGSARREAAGRDDPRRAAAAAAAAGDYAAAAHHLYAAVLAALAARALVRLHPSKTAGDYARDLRAPARGRARAAPADDRTAAARAYAAFARGYEAVVYGPTVPDRARYEALAVVAAPLLDAAPTAGGGAQGATAPAAAAA
jgi:hypothetical protein